MPKGTRLSPVTNGVPATAEIRRALGAALGHEVDGIDVHDRRSNDDSSTFPSEVVRVRLPDGSELLIHCKYSGGIDNSSCGHRGGVAYEANIYQSVLACAPRGAPRFIGSHAGRDGSEAWLFVEYLEGVTRVSRSCDVHAMARAAAWIGTFQRRLDWWPRTTPEAATVMRYDAAYFRGWIELTCDYLAFARRVDWLRELAAHAEVIGEMIAALTPAVIHGEYTTSNVLYRQGVVHPVDWEAAAIGAGEIDLAFITDGWDHDSVQVMERAYYEARYPEGRPEGAAEALQLARLYLETRWLGDVGLWKEPSDLLWRVAHLKEVATGLAFA